MREEIIEKHVDDHFKNIIGITVREHPISLKGKKKSGKTSYIYRN